MLSKSGYNTFMKTKTLNYSFIVSTILLGAALACNTLGGGSPNPTDVVLPTEAIPDIFPTGDDILGLDETPQATLEPGQPLEGDCIEDINPGDEVLLPVTEGIIEIQLDQFISVAGEVTNNTDQWVIGTLIWVRMCDETGTQLLHRESFYTMPSQIPPGGTVPFHLLRDVANTEGRVFPSQYRIEAVAIYGDDSIHAELVDLETSESDGQLTVKGTFVNAGSEPCLSPNIIVAFYKDGKVYETHYLLPQEISEIAPGDSSPVDDYLFIPEGATDPQFFPACQ
jgi:hypothetical protein